MATSTPSTKIELEVGDIFDCPICLDKLKVPKYLPCLHTYCEACIRSYIESTAAYTEQTEMSEFTIHCPVCRKIVTCNDRNVKIENWAKNLPLNHLILSLIDSNKQSSDSAGVGIKMCSCCERNSESTEAKFWCKQCPDFLCEPCKIFHGKFRQFLTHEVLCLEDVKDFGCTIPEVEEPCPIHKGKVFEVYCKDHRKLCCSVCFATQHRTCSSVISVDDVSQEPGVTSGAESFVELLSSFALLLDKAIKVKEDNILAVESEQKTFLDDMSKKINDIKQLLDKLYQMVQTSVSGVCGEQLSKLRSTEEQLKGFKATLTGDEKLLQAVIQHGNTKQMFLTCEKLKVQILEHFKQLEPAIQADREVHLKFTENRALQSLLDLQTLADVDVIKSGIKCNSYIESAAKGINTSGGLVGEDVNSRDRPIVPDKGIDTNLVVEHNTPDKLNKMWERSDSVNNVDSLVDLPLRENSPTGLDLEHNTKTNANNLEKWHTSSYGDGYWDEVPYVSFGRRSSNVAKTATNSNDRRKRNSVRSSCIILGNRNVSNDPRTFNDANSNVVHDTRSRSDRTQRKDKK